MLSFSRRIGLTCGTLALAAILCAESAHAGTTTITLSGGWQASWDSSLNPYISLNDHGVVNGALFIEKIVEFTAPPVNGVFPAVNIVFQQISPNAVSNIVIDDEIITNSTGSPWTAFTMDLLGSPNVTFDPVATAASGGFSVNPFTSSAFSNGNQTFTAFNGTVPAGGFWFPGSVSGQLWINIANMSPTSGISFTLSERPIPAPAALALLGVAGLVGTRRRR